MCACVCVFEFSHPLLPLMTLGRRDLFVYIVGCGDARHTARHTALGHMERKTVLFNLCAVSSQPIRKGIKTRRQVVFSEGHIGRMLLIERHIGRMVLSEEHIGRMVLSEGHIGRMVPSEGHIGRMVLSDGHIGRIVLSEAE